jgi:GxxExxY protein
METAYEVTLPGTLEERGLIFQRQVPSPIVCESQEFEEGFRADLIIDGKVIVELKSVEMIPPLHKKQLFTSLRQTGLRLGYLLNFGSPLTKEITRINHGQL